MNGYTEGMKNLESKYGIRLAHNDKPVIPSKSIVKELRMDIKDVDKFLENLLLVFQEIKDNNTIEEIIHEDKNGYTHITYDIDLTFILFLSRYVDSEYNEVIMNYRRTFYEYERLLDKLDKDSKEN